ncbi:flagellar hook-associated protein FlgK [Uliginosibacterium sp. H1]|uniref:flagellar hook-associated protein FlgK n=1 Tax=Uliginosibacterium sp. H1 TaxID=3114757 RepID=UPI002E185515|nr:flagellar hook-associated protein FlgK [Uliginosibacterium sp. H1]
MSMLSIGLTGLNAAQAGLTTAGHNITNAGVTGYTRQQAIQGTNTPMFSGAGFFGQGTRIETVRRMYDQFLENQVLAADTSRAELETYSYEINQIDNLLADETVGLSPSLQEFFKGIQEVAANAASVPSRQSMLSASEALVSRFQSLYTRMEDIRHGVESQITQTVTDINALAGQIAQLNQQIVTAQVAGPGVPANDLLDKRNNLIAELNRQVRVSTTTEADGSVNVFIGTGQPLVVNTDTFTLTASPSPDDISRLAVGLSMPNGTAVALPESLVTGGNLGGLLKFRSESLDKAQNAMGRIAVGLTETFNAQHRLGQDLDGNMGGNYFVPLTPTVQNLPAPGTGVPPTATVTASITSVSALTTQDYLLSYDGTNYQLRHQSNGAIVYSGATLPTNVEGISVSLAAGTINAGDRFLIQPTRAAAGAIEVAIKDTRLVAAGAPIRTLTANTNSGSGSITQGTVVSNTGIAATVPHIGNITLTFDSATNQFVLGGAAAGTLAYNPSSESSGKTFTLASPNISFRIAGAPGNGDVFTITSNDSGVSDNRNAVALGQLQSAKTLIGGGASYEFAYSQLVGDVGSKAREVKVGAEAQEALLDQAKSAQQSVSGVNLDEEAANLVRFQQAYQASARVMNTANTLFNEILGIARG